MTAVLLIKVKSILVLSANTFSVRWRRTYPSTALQSGGFTSAGLRHGSTELTTYLWIPVLNSPATIQKSLLATSAADGSGLSKWMLMMELPLFALMRSILGLAQVESASITTSAEVMNRCLMIAPVLVHPRLRPQLR